MNLLAFDTSTEALTVACVRDDGKTRTESEFSHFGVLEHSEKIIPAIEGTLKSSRLALDDCDAFLIGQGPGSFTGLRVGFATLQGLVESSGKRCYGVPSPDIIAWGSRAHEGMTAVVMDARRGKVYLGIFSSGAGRSSRVGKYQCLTPEEAGAVLKPLSRKKLWITGDGLSRYEKVFREGLPKALFAGKVFWYPRALHLIEIFEEKRESLEPIPESGRVPIYLQEPHIGPPKTKIHVHTA